MAWAQGISLAWSTCGLGRYRNCCSNDNHHDNHRDHNINGALKPTREVVESVDPAVIP